MLHGFANQYRVKYKLLTPTLKHGARGALNYCSGVEITHISYIHMLGLYTVLYLESTKRLGANSYRRKLL